MKFPLTHSDIPACDREMFWDVVFEMIKEHFVNLGKEKGINIKASIYNKCFLDLVFQSEEDINLFRLTTNIKEGEDVMFNDQGARLTLEIKFYCESEIYG
jgi:hypothetical protein